MWVAPTLYLTTNAGAKEYKDQLPAESREDSGEDVERNNVN